MSGFHVDFEPEAAPKHALQRHIRDSLNKVLEDARTFYELQIASVPQTCGGKRAELKAEYLSTVDFLLASAGQAYEDAVDKERDGEWSAQFGVMPEEWSSALRQEQEAILEDIKRKKGTPSGGERPSRETTIPDRVERSTVSIPSTQPTPHNAASSPWTGAGIFDDQHPEMPEEAAARERREEHERKQEEFQNRAGVPLSNEDIIKLLLFHDQQWSYIAECTPLHWSDFPWPVLSFAGLKSQDDLTFDAVSAYITLEFNLRTDKATPKWRLKEHIRKWHPDRFEQRYLEKVPEGTERDNVRGAAGMVARFLNQLLANLD
jgi:hypothetical protein